MQPRPDTRSTPPTTLGEDPEPFDPTTPNGQLRALRAGETLGSLDFAGARLIGEDLSGLDFSRADLRGADLSRSNLSGATLLGANLEDAVLCEVDLSDAECAGAKLHGADLRNSRLHRTGLGMADLTESRLGGADLCGASLVGADARGADLRVAMLEDLRAERVDLRGADLTRATLHRADLASARVDEANFDGADLRESDLRNMVGYERASWVGVDLRGIDFTGAYLARNFILDQNFLAEFRSRSRWSAIVYAIWKLTSDCGRSLGRWAVCTLVATLVFAWAYTLVAVDYGDYETPLSPLYYSVVTITTLGYGDVLPASVPAQIVAMCQVIVGYVMLGGLLTIFTKKMASRASE